MSKQQTPQEIISHVMAREQLPAGFAAVATDYFLPLTEHIVNRHDKKCHEKKCHEKKCHDTKRGHDRSQALVVGVNGAQGTGKSTLSGLLRQLLQARQLNCVVISIDDLYLTREERKRLAADVHPLLATRGVPGTHDLESGLSLIKELKAAKADSRIAIPLFDKARDERSPQSDWRIHIGPVDVILIEGWCVGAQPTSLSGSPINALEQDHDIDGVWRSYIETRLLDYQRLFRQIDLLVMLKAPSMDSIIEWRTLQEEKLRERAGATQQGIMNKEELLWFIMHYERLTRHMLDTMPAQADVVFWLDKEHRITHAHYREHEVGM